MEDFVGELSGKELCARRRSLEEECSDLASNLVDLNPT